MLKFVFLFGAFAVCAAKSAGENARIVGSNKLAENGQFPYMVSVRRLDIHYCGGSIIDKKWILTSADCANNVPWQELSVRVGDIYNWRGTQYAAKNVVLHKNYDGDTYVYNIALIKLEVSINFVIGLVSPIQLSTEYIGAKERLKMCGWGKTCRTGGVVDRLRYIHPKSISNKECAHAWGRKYILDYNICTSTKTGKGCCVHDHGGPLVYNGKLVGILSWHHPSCADGLPDVYTRVSSIEEWIKYTIKSN